MRQEEFVMRGQTPSNNEEILNFSGHKKGYAYKLTEFKLYPSTTSSDTGELAATLTAGKTSVDPEAVNFKDEGLIGVTALGFRTDSKYYETSVINDTFLITQNLILRVVDTEPGTPMAVNWQCKFMPVKMSGAEEAVTNYKQFMISDE